MNNWKKLATTYNNYMRNSLLPEDVKEQVDKIFSNKELRKKYTADEIAKKIHSIKLENCPICNGEIFLGFECKNKISLREMNNINFDFLNEKQRKHYLNLQISQIYNSSINTNITDIAKENIKKVYNDRFKIGLKESIIIIQKLRKENKIKEIKKCPLCNCENTDGLRFAMCQKCFDNLPGNGNIIRICIDCGNYIKTNHNFDLCPVCHHRGLHHYEHICKNCGKKEINSIPDIGRFKNFICDNCIKELNKSQLVKLYYDYNSRLDTIIKNNLLLRPIFEHFDPRQFKIRTCKVCNRSFRPKSPNQKTCQCCYEIHECPICNEKFIKSPNINKNINHDKLHFCSKSCSTKHQMINKNIKINIKNIDKNNFALYNEWFNKIDIDKLIEINDNNIYYYNKKGIWCKVDKDTKEILDVMYTTDIRNEYNYIQKALKFENSYKYNELRKYKNIMYLYIDDFNTEYDGLLKEMIFAIKFNAKYWNPAPGIQSKIYYKNLGGNNI